MFMNIITSACRRSKKRRAYLRSDNIPMAATHSPTLTAITIMIAAARPAQNHRRTDS